MPALQSEVLDRDVQGYHTGGLPMAMAGLVKGTLGVVVRPTVGVLELVSKGTHGMGLVCLGREAITGSAQRRVRAPGALVEEQTEVSPTLTTPQLENAGGWAPARSSGGGAHSRPRTQRGFSSAGCG